MRPVVLLAALCVASSACSSSAHAGRALTTRSTVGQPTSSTTHLSTSTAAPTAAPTRSASVCGSTAAPPARYRHVVVIMEENRRWPDVGGPGFGAMPYVHSLARSCAYYARWNETNARQNSLTQYIGITSGVNNPATVNDCSPSATCRSTDDNIFRQVRNAGGTARSYVEGATAACSAAGGAAKHVPALYYFGDDDHAHCQAEVRPFSEFDVNHLPTFAMITPDLCNDGHNCANSRVDAWLAVHLSALLRTAAYRAGTTAVFIAYDEDRPVPNLIIAPTARRGPITSIVASHSAALRTWDELLGLPILASVRGVASLRASAHI